MANLITAPTFFPRRLSSYVPAMAYASDVSISGEARISFGAPAAALVTWYASAVSVASAGTIAQASLLNSGAAAEPYGRAVIVQLSGAGTGTIIIDGYDYLGQPMSENIALNGASVVIGNKAFKWLRLITFPTVGAVTLSVGVGSALGLPYKALRVLTEEFAGAPVATLGTLSVPSLVVPATATTTDPRGTYISTSTMNGTSLLTATFEFVNDVDANNNGGLHGVPHFAN